MAAFDTQITQKVTAALSKDVEFVKCECCGLTEECTEEYKTRVQERFHGRWICGLCSEAVKDEVMRSQSRIGNEEALNRHMSFCKKFRSLSPPPNPTEELCYETTYFQKFGFSEVGTDEEEFIGLIQQQQRKRRSCFSAMEIQRKMYFLSSRR